MPACSGPSFDGATCSAAGRSLQPKRGNDCYHPALNQIRRRLFRIIHRVFTALDKRKGRRFYSGLSARSRFSVTAEPLFPRSVPPQCGACKTPARQTKSRRRRRL